MSPSLAYLLDTNVVSETRKKQPDSRVLSFLSNTAPSSLYVSVLTLGELRKGVAIKQRTDPSTAKLLDSWVDGLEFTFTDRILGIDAAITRLWGEWSALRPRPVVDTLLAATAVHHELTLVTRNTGDVADLPGQSLNPWQL